MHRCAVVGLIAVPAALFPAEHPAEAATADTQTRSISPVRGIRRDPAMNQANTPLYRYLPSDYSDGSDDMAGPQRASAREISNLVFAQTTSRPNDVRATDFVWQWGQFLDHDLDLTDGTSPPEPYPIPVPTGDPFFDPASTGVASIGFNRSVHEHDDTGTRQQVNEITGWIDASQVYGSDEIRRDALRSHDGSGRLLVSEGNLLPYNIPRLPNAGGDSADLFLAGDVRANEQVGLTAMHTLFVREHNRIADRLRRAHPEATGDEIYRRSRRLVIAELQHITYSEFLPVLLGREALPRYRGYKASVDARIMNSFSTAAYRFGHSMLNSTLLRVDKQLQPIGAGHLELADAFFAPEEIEAYGIDPMLRGLAIQAAQDVDTFVVDAVRNFLFGPPGAGGFDLVALNIQRGRDHGLPSYNQARRYMGMPQATDFRDITSDVVVIDRLQSAYASVEDVDFWVGGLAEQRHPGSMLGRLFHRLVRKQFRLLRDGDPNWYQNILNRQERRQVEALRLADIIRLNTEIRDELPDDVFRLPRQR